MTAAESDVELVACHIWDLDSLNKTKLNQSITLKPDEKYALKINDSIEFGSLKFKLSTVSRVDARPGLGWEVLRSLLAFR